MVPFVYDKALTTSQPPRPDSCDGVLRHVRTSAASAVILTSSARLGRRSNSLNAGTRLHENRRQVEGHGAGR